MSCFGTSRGGDRQNVDDISAQYGVDAPSWATSLASTGSSFTISSGSNGQVAGGNYQGEYYYTDSPPDVHESYGNQQYAWAGAAPDTASDDVWTEEAASDSPPKPKSSKKADNTKKRSSKKRRG